MRVLITLLFAILSFCRAVPAFAAYEPVEPLFADIVFKAKVIEIHSSGIKTIAGTEQQRPFQDISVKITEGSREGEVVELENDGPTGFAVGDEIYVRRSADASVADASWSVDGPDRIGVLAWLFGAFFVVVLVTAGLSGIRALIALIGSVSIISLGLLPALSAGLDPVAISLVFAVGILSFSMFVTHGVNRSTFVALISSIISLFFSAFAAQLAVVGAKMTGFTTDETVFLSFATNGTINLPGLLLGGILIGIVGILNDISVSQVHTVKELMDANPTLTRRELFLKGMRVGREHLGAVINMLPLAYVGASLPLLLLFQATGSAPFSYIVNHEIFSAEIIRTLAGSIGLMGSGAIATLAAAALLHQKALRKDATLTPSA